MFYVFAVEFSLFHVLAAFSLFDVLFSQFNAV